MEFLARCTGTEIVHTRTILALYWLTLVFLHPTKPHTAMSHLSLSLVVASWLIPF